MEGNAVFLEFSENVCHAEALADASV